MTMDTTSDLTTASTAGSTNNKNDDAPTCNMPDDAKDKDVIMTDMDASNKNVHGDNDKAPTAAFDQLTLTRSGTEISLSEGEDADASGGGKEDSKNDYKDGDTLMEDKKREKEFKPHKTVASKKKVKVDDNDDDVETMDENENYHEVKASSAALVVAKKPEDSNAMASLAEDENLKDVLDLAKLYEFMEQNKNAATKLAGKDLLLLIGYTGAGKTSTTKYLAGTKFEFDEDKDDYIEVSVPDGLEEFIRSDSSKSVTKAIHATEIKGPGGNTVTICDTPGFGDTKGVEMEISNGLMITRSLKQALSVKPVLVVNGGELVSTARGGQLQKTLDIVITMFGKIDDFSAFEYVFTSWETKKAGRIHKKLVKLLKDLQSESDGILADSADKKDGYIAILSDMVEKTKTTIHVIDLEDEDGALELLEALVSNDLRVSSDAFVEFVSMDAKTKLKFQVNCMNTRLDNALKGGDMESTRRLLQQLQELASSISLQELETAVKAGKRKLAEHCKKVEAIAEEIIVLCNEEEDLAKYGKFSSKLYQKLQECTEIQEICKFCGITEAGDSATYLHSALQKLFNPIQAKLATINESDLFDKAQILQDSLMKCMYSSKSLESLFAADDDRLREYVSSFKEKVFSWIKVAASDLEPEQPITAELVKKIHPNILFLLDIHLFLHESNIELPRMAEIEGAVHEVLESTETECNAQIDILSKLGKSSMDILTDEYPSQTERIDRLECLCDDLLKAKVTDARMLLKAMANAPSRFTSAIYKGSPPKPGLIDVAECFDKSFSTLVEKVSILIDDSASQVLSGESAQLFEPQIEAESKVDVALEKIHAFVESEITTIDELTRTIDIMDEACLHAVDAWASFTFKSLKAQEAHDSASALRNKLNSKRTAYSQLCNEIETFNSDDGPGLNDEQIEGFRQLGFDLSKFGAEREFTLEQLGRTFFYNFKALKEYMDAYDGNSYVDAKVNKDLAKWTDKQRKLYKDVMAGKENEMDDVHIEALNAIGFSFAIKTRSDILWDAKFEQLVAFQKANGHCRVTLRERSNGKSKFTPLGQWVDNMRTARRGTNPGRLNPDRIRRLNEIGFVWDASR